jgi:hypothetical protein
MSPLEPTRRIKAAALALGKRLDEAHLARLRSALGYLEIGSLLSRLSGGSDVTALPDRFSVFQRAVDEVRGARPLYLEFGVYRGWTMRWWSEHLTQPGAQLVGFDSFAGLPQSWRPGFEAGRFETDGPPDIRDPRVSFVTGWFEDTLAGFKPPEHDQLIVNIDCDLYSSTETALAWVEPYLASGTLLYFDELSDRDHELRALEELLARSSVKLEPVALAGAGTHVLFRVR